MSQYPARDSESLFCGKLTSDQTVVDSDSKWTFVPSIKNQCFVNFQYFWPHFTIIPVLLLALLYIKPLGRIDRSPNHGKNYQLTFPLHTLRCSVFIALILVQLLNFGEGIITDVEIQGHLPTQPQLYIPPILATLATVVVAIYYQKIEVWNKPSGLGFLLVYWFWALVIEIVRLINLSYEDEFGIGVMRVLICMALMTTYAVLISIECHVFVYKSRFGRNNLLEDLPDDLVDENFQYLNEYSNLYSKRFLVWMKNGFDLSIKKALELVNLGNVPKSLRSQEQCERMLAEIQKQRQQNLDRGISNPTTRLVPILMNIYGWKMALTVVIRIVTSPSSVVTSLFIRGILNYINVIQHGGYIITMAHNATVKEFFRNGFVLASCLGVISLSLELLTNYSSFLLSQTVTPARSALQAVINQKGLRMSARKLQKSETEDKRTSSVIFEDINNVVNGMTCLPTILGAPCLVIFNSISLCKLLGPSSIPALFIIILTSPLSRMIFQAYSKVLSKSMSRAEERMKVTMETIAGIKVVKLFGWEDIFFGKITTARDQQEAELRKGLVAGGLFIPGWIIGETLATITALGSYSLFQGGRPLTPDVAFPALVLLVSTASQVVFLPSALRVCLNANASIEQLQTYLGAPEVEHKSTDGASMTPVSKVRPEGQDASTPEREPLLESLQYGTFSYSQFDKKPTYSEPTVEEDTEAMDIPDGVAIRITDGSFTWNTESAVPTLHDISVDIPSGKLTMVIGEEGSGKSTLLSAMLGEIQTVKGVVNRSKNKTAALVDKIPWIQNTTLKDSIILENDEDERRYLEVIRCCGLRHDISILPAGDETKIGEGGIKLSEEQKQRISIGRALYSTASIVFLDDPFSDLDSQVAGDLFAEGFQGFLRDENRTIIMVTHQLKNFEMADHIIMMKGGTIHAQGSPGQIQEEYPDLRKMRQQMEKTEVSGEKETERKAQEERLRLFRRISEYQKEEQMISFISGLEGRELDDEDNSNIVTLTREVKTETVPWSVFFYLAKMAGVTTLCTLIIAVLFLQAFETGSHFWLRNWSQLGFESIEQGKSQYFPTRYYVIGYTLLTIGSFTFSFLVGFLVFWAALRVGSQIHTISLTSVLRSPLRFFDITPGTQIMSRFSGDLHTIDHELGLQITVLIMTTISVVNGIIINITLAGMFSVIALLPFLGLSFLVIKYHLISIRDITRLEGMSLSPIYTHYAETLAGLRTIRAYEYQKQRFMEYFRRVDQYSLVSLFKSSAGVWLAVHLALINNITFAVLGCVLVGLAKSGTLVTSAVGLGLASIINFTTIVNNAVKVEMLMTAAERLSDYDNLPEEEYGGIVDPPTIWPDEGEIVMDGVSVRYDEDLDPVLKNVCLKIKPREKIGIGGGKGSGKSSLALSLFRISDIFSGNIYIDGMNVKHIPLTRLRQKLAIVPQEPFLFTGSIRFNLDPYGNLTDEELWEALEIADLRMVVEGLHGDLDAMVSEEGENFTVGQRQLFCLARAFIKDTKILIMDEPTASIDTETGTILRNIVASAFNQRTVITIAHRAGMILGADRAVVMDDGRVVENDTPINLLQGDTLFTTLVQQKHDPVGIVIHSKECSCGH